MFKKLEFKSPSEKINGEFKNERKKGQIFLKISGRDLSPQCVSKIGAKCPIYVNPSKFFGLQVILFEIDCAIFYTNLQELFWQFISWTNWVNSCKYMDNCWISCQVMADMKKVCVDLIIINLYVKFSLTLVKLHFWKVNDQIST